MDAEALDRGFFPQQGKWSRKDEYTDPFTTKIPRKRPERIVSTQTIIARISVLVLAVSIATFVLISKRWDDIEAFWIRKTGTATPVSYFSKPDSEVGTVSKEYVICTRSRRGIYTVDDAQGGIDTTQCMVINSEGRIAATGRIGRCSVRFFFRISD